MKVYIPSNCGFCGGVKRAVALAEAALKYSPEVYTLGELIHNSEVVEELKNKGIIPVYSLEGLSKKVVVIRSHGVGKSVYEILRLNGNRIIDATCPSVKKIHDKVAEYFQKGYRIIIFGDETHAEVKGIAGWCSEPIITNDASGFILPEDGNKWFVVAQTTANPALYDVFKKNLNLQVKNNQKTVEFFNSICYTTSDRLKECANVATMCDTVFVLGDSASSNTVKLFKTASAICKNTYLISNVAELHSVANKKNITKLGVIAGASTPKRLIMEVINRMDQENKVDTIVTDEVTNNEAVAEATEVAVVPEVAEATAETAPVAEQVTAEDAIVEEKPVETAEKVAVAPAAPTAPQKKEEMTMAEGMRKYGVRSYREGMKCKATIISVDPTGVSVSVQGISKNDSGFISGEEMELDGSYDAANYSIGEELDVVIIPKTDPKMKAINLSKKAFDEIKIEDEAVKKILQGEEFTLACNQAVKGGLLGKLGTYTIFVPASHIRIGYVKNLEDYVGKKMRLRILPPKEEEIKADEEGAETHRKPNPKRILASQRIVLEEEKTQRESEFWDSMQVNYIVKGKVKRFTDYAAFVSVMNYDCFAHISDLSWTKINHPSEVLELNKTYDFVVIKVDREAGRVSLGYKQLQKKPYELAAEKYHVGDVITGKVERIKDFGAFIELEPGIDGLVHVSEIGHKWIASASEALKVGDEINAKIIGFENNKITLSMKALIEPPVVEEAPAESEATAENGEGAEKTNRVARFNRRAGAADNKDGEKKERRPRRNDKPEDDGEPHEYVSEGNVKPTLGDLFKNIDLKFEEEPAKAEAAADETEDK